MKMITKASKKLIWACAFVSLALCAKADDGHNLWLRPVNAKAVKVTGANPKSATLAIAKKEIEQAWLGTAGATVKLKLVKDPTLKADGFKIAGNTVSATTESGILYGVYEMLRRQQTGNISNVVSNPSYQIRILNHWDNLNGSIERGYAGNSIFWRAGDNAFTVTDADKKRWEEYARANASIGINASVLNNVNASPNMLGEKELARMKAIAAVLRPYGIKTYLAINFASPMRLGGLKTADPLDPEVIKWWKAKVAEVYKLVPDFGGFLVKANSEGQPGPQDFKRTHADGANMLADALKPYKGIVMWRAFVYNAEEKDRAKQAYLEFMPFDGKFRDNVIIQVKNGPIDFQPREPFSPLFGAMKKTPVMPELQITQEYLGHAEQLAFLATMWEELYKSDTYQEGKNSTVARVTDGSIFPQKYTAVAGVSNVGLDTNWTGHDFAQANWYAFGRLAWNNQLKSEDIANEWIKLTFAPTIENKDWNKGFYEPVKKMMLDSREVVVNYSMPLGLHHIFAGNHHYGPGAWYAPRGTRKDWTPPYYHQADENGIGFDRTKTGTDAVDQYHEPLSSEFNNVATTPEIYLLYFHHLSWDYKLKNGQTLWDALCNHWNTGVNQVRQFQVTWDKVQPYVDAERFTRVQEKLRRQTRDAQFWKDANLLYFQQFSKRPFPDNVERPINNLNYYITTDPLSMKPVQQRR
ncbi:alpha-glucuronidase [Mucilaginibacter auburnensis]|uniref:Alpha-glucuronidase n=1 Tax=Mucilaginibacter auburnensis TaxID=1457233 RepID=A0A2H9VW71_9SPHI|nr:alpha-glucuronidase [Mucilaginibacter auburnensis]PJJ85065.1 alpha-glucuronidase [Mucilaginibacter auburnensis]